MPFSLGTNIITCTLGGGVLGLWEQASLSRAGGTKDAGFTILNQRVSRLMWLGCRGRGGEQLLSPQLHPLSGTNELASPV